MPPGTLVLSGKKNEGGAALVSGLSRLRLLSVLLTLVLVAPLLGGRLSDRPVASSQTSSMTSRLMGVACASPSTCVVVGGEGTILRSTDGGSTWHRQPSGAPKDFLNAVACASPSTCVVVGTSVSTRRGTILRTTNGGSTWRSQAFGAPNTLLDAVACPSPSTCVAVGGSGAIVRSTDGGRTWRSV
jgi:photosystem II stability/assembly factor-like uncharacterized protein